MLCFVIICIWGKTKYVCFFVFFVHSGTLAAHSYSETKQTLTYINTIHQNMNVWMGYLIWKFLSLEMSITSSSDQLYHKGFYFIFWHAPMAKLNTLQTTSP